MNHWVDAILRHALVGGDEPGHQVEQVAGLRTGEMDSFPVHGDRFADVVLRLAVVGGGEASVNNPILKVDQVRLVAEILLFGQLQKSDESLGAIGVGPDMLDFEG
jgi:hypothetical protein